MASGQGKNKIAIVAITQEGKRIAGRLTRAFSHRARLYFPDGRGSLKQVVSEIFDKNKFAGLIFIMASGIVVRLIASHLKDKYRDPAVIVVDESSRFAISLLSGHEGGANRLALEVGSILKAEPVITTASESKKDIIVGVGCRRGIKKEEMAEAIKSALRRSGSHLKAVRYVATIDLKRNELGLRDACLELGLPLKIISSELIKNFRGAYQRSTLVKKKIGVEGVSEPCALLAGKNTKLILPKLKMGKITVAIAREHKKIGTVPSGAVPNFFAGLSPYKGIYTGRLYLVGIGPGDTGFLTRKASEAIAESEVVIGYRTYIKLLGHLLEGKEVISFGMTQELDRAREAIRYTRAGKRVCLISSGDPGIYGMAGVVLELLSWEEDDQIKIEIIPGVMAACGCASLLGAPLMNDFAVISLSDILTDVGLIKQRIRLASQADLVIVLYNPKSSKRVEPLKSAWQILMEYRSPLTPVGIVRNSQRDNEEVIVTTLKDMLSFKHIDMTTTVIVGNSQTYVKGKYMVTPRGYKK